MSWAPERERQRGHHDWHSATYVDEWITSDVTRDNERRPMLREMLKLAPFASDAPIEVLDIGAGYGVVSEVVLQTFPNARVTLQDYSAPMFEQSQRRLAAYADRIRYVQSDLASPAWTETTGGPFDLAVSAICIHNLREPELMASVYAGVRRVLRPDGVFLDADYVRNGGLQAHLDWLRTAGFARVVGDPKDERLAVMAAYVNAH
ncbi:MAG: methyltransferase domain-containing protein [Chloroflexi bacterium]|nr:methyltransferase domain-containing protein [Chloroflexota bacterium]